MDSTVSRYRRRLLQEWPRVVVALVSLYGIYYAANTIQLTSERIKAIGAFSSHPHTGPLLSPMDSASAAIPTISPVPIAHSSPSQLQLNPPENKSEGDNRIDLSSSDTSNKNKDMDRGKENNNKNRNNNVLSKLRLYSTQSSLLPNTNANINANGGQSYILVDFDGRVEAGAIYTLLVISSLSILDNGIGLMVATRRSLRLTQVAFAIWCLRFLFRILSLISVLFMLAVGTEYHGFGSDLPNSVMDGSDNMDGEAGSGTGSKQTMITITVLEIIVALVHGWSLVVLIQDLRNQPRPRTVLARLWSWFCGTRWGRRLGLQPWETDINSNSNSDIYYSGLVHGRNIGAGMENAGSRGNSSIWDREMTSSLGFGSGLMSSASSIRSVAASFGIGSGLVSSGSSIRSVAASIPEMAIAVGRPRASSISSFSSDEKV